MRVKRWVLLLVLLVGQTVVAQEIVVSYAISTNPIDTLILSNGLNKQMPEKFRRPILYALSHYPELTETKIKFKLKRSGSPLASKINFWGLFQNPGNRTYIISIRTKHHEIFDAILLNNMNLDAQVGAIGHELAHTSDFQNRKFGRMFRVVAGNLSSKYLDRQEFSTDDRAINHGLGFQLFAWHSIGSQLFKKIQDPQQAKELDVQERYMRPATVIKKMRLNKIYATYLEQINAL